MSLLGTIVSIEDDEDDQFMIRQVIEQLSLPNELRFFHNGQEALDYLITTTERPFLLLCGINMPLMNGLELRQRVHQNDYLRQKSIPFVFLTTAASEEHVRLAYNESVQGFYKKAVTYEGLQNQIRLIIESGRTASIQQQSAY